MQTQFILSYRIGLYFHDYKLVVKIDENGHNNRNIDCEIKRQKAIEHELGCKFIKIDPGAIYEIFRHIKQSIKKFY